MKSSEALREHIQEIIQNQLVENDPPEVQETLERLKYKGYSDDEAKKLIGRCVAVELYDIFSNNLPFQHDRYIRHLQNLPDPPENDSG